MYENVNISMRTNTFKHAEFKSEEFPLRRPTVFSQTAILCLLNSRQNLSLFNDTDGADTRLHNSKWLIRVNQSPHLTNDRFP